MGNIIIGLAAIAAGIFTLIMWPWRVLEMLQGLTPIVLIGVGIIAVVAGLEFLKESAGTEETEESDTEK